MRLSYGIWNVEQGKYVKFVFSRKKLFISHPAPLKITQNQQRIILIKIQL